MKVSGRKPGGTNSSTHQRKAKSGTVKINGCDRVDVRDKSLSLRSSEYMFYKENFAERFLQIAFYKEIFYPSVLQGGKGWMDGVRES